MTAERAYTVPRPRSAQIYGVTEFYRARTDTKMTIVGGRPAVIAAVTLPVTATSSIAGMNLIVNDQTLWGPIALLLGFMATISILLLVWAKRQGWCGDT